MWLDIAIGVALILGFVGAAHLAIALLARTRHIMPTGCLPVFYAVPALFAAMCVYQCSVREYDVTQRFARETKTRWCTSEDAFLFQFSDEPHVFIDIAGPSSGLPNNITQFEADHTWWHPNAPRASNEPARPATYNVWAAVPKGTPFHVVRIVEEHHPESGVFLKPKIQLEGKLRRFGEIDALFLLSSDDRNTLAIGHAHPCDVPPNSGSTP